MRTITAKQAIEVKGWTYAIVSEDEYGLYVFGFYSDKRIAERVAGSLNEYNEDGGYEVAWIV